jgi:hypothetical protein
VWGVRRYGDFDAGGLLPTYVGCLFGRRPVRRRARSAGHDMRNRSRAAVVERHDARTDLDHDVSILITAMEVAGG